MHFLQVARVPTKKGRGSWFNSKPLISCAYNEKEEKKRKRWRGIGRKGTGRVIEVEKLKRLYLTSEEEKTEPDESSDFEISSLTFWKIWWIFVHVKWEDGVDWGKVKIGGWWWTMWQRHGEIWPHSHGRKALSHKREVNSGTTVSIFNVAPAFSSSARATNPLSYARFPFSSLHSTPFFLLFAEPEFPPLLLRPSCTALAHVHSPARLAIFPSSPRI